MDTSNKHFTKKLILALFGILLVGLLLLGIQFRRLLFSPMLPAGQTSIAFEIQPGTPAIALAWQLKRQNLLKNPAWFVAWARWHGDLDKIKRGEYLIEAGKTTPAQFLADVVAGKMIMHPFTIIEGWNFAQIMTALNNNPYLTHTLTTMDNAMIMQKISGKNENPEGWFYPDTYLFGKGTPDSKILQKAYQAMQTLVNTEWQQRMSTVAYQTPYQALIAASLIEKETALTTERPMIAGVILNRLQKNMRLQIDPTVIYAMGPAYNGQLTSKDLVRVKSPYNTYLNAGLPPTPIAMPSRASIHAALHPANTDALYYVASGKGGHIFSTSLKAHDMAIREYLLQPKMCFGLILLFPTSHFMSSCSL